jgi:eukaryotic-like serine/threonine-protein kinase
MGTVYRARDPGLDREVALKTIAPQQLAERDALERFKREARAAARLQHPNIVTIYELGEFSGIHYIAMELLHGVSLAEAMRHGLLAAIARLRVAIDVCHGLDYAHKNGVLHRDVKPANIVLLDNGTPKIVDFGIARLDDTAITRTGIVLGTPSYLSPEMLRGARVDHRSDMWSLGVVLYELLAGRLPFVGTPFDVLARRIVGEPAPPLDVSSLGLPQQVAAVVLRALAKEPSARFRDLGEMADALGSASGFGPGAPADPHEAEPREVLARHLRAARERLRLGDFEGAQNEARRAQALDPSLPDVLALLREVEDRLQAATAPTVVAAAPATAPTAMKLPPPATAPARVRAASAASAPAPWLRGAATAREVALFGEPQPTSIACFAPKAGLVALSGADGSVRVWDLRSRIRRLHLRSELHQRTGHDAAALCLDVSRDGSLLASGHADGAVRLWDLATGREVRARLRHEGLVASLAFSPDATVLASGGVDATLRLWEVRAALTGEARRELHRQPSGVTALLYAGPAGQWLVTGHSKPVLRVVDARSGRLATTLRGPEAQIHTLACTVDGRVLAAASHDRSIRVYDIESRQPMLQGPGGRTRPNSALAFSPDGRHLLGVALDNAVQIWSLDSASLATTLWGQPGESFVAVAVLEDGQQLGVALADGRIRLWGPATP